MNEESVASCLQFFKETREARQTGAYQQQMDLESKMMSMQLTNQQ